VDLSPSLSSVRCAVGLGLAAIQLSREFSADGGGASGIKTIPELAHELDPLLRRESVDGKCVGSHTEIMRLGAEVRNGHPARDQQLADLRPHPEIQLAAKRLRVPVLY
jgi:hypothetical protein